MKRMKSKLAALLSVSLVLGMALPAYASPVDASGDQATYTVKVENVPAGYLRVSYTHYPEEGNWSNYIHYVLPIDEEVELPAGASLYVYGNGVYGSDFESECTSLTVNGEEISSNRHVVVDEDLLISGSFVAYKTENSSTDRIVFENRSTWKNVLTTPTELPLFLRKAGERNLTALTGDIAITQCRFYNGDRQVTLDEIPFEIHDGTLFVDDTATPGEYQLRLSTDIVKNSSLYVVVGRYAQANEVLAKFEYTSNSGLRTQTYSFDSVSLYDLKVDDEILSKFNEEAFDSKLYSHDFSHLLLDDVQIGANDTIGQYYPDDESELIFQVMFDGYDIPLIPAPTEIVERPTQGWIQQNGNWSYLDQDGTELTNTILYDKDGKLYYLDQNGYAAQDEFVTVPAEEALTFYTETEGATAPIKEVSDEDRVYYFGTDRTMKSGWIETADGSSYANPADATNPYEVASGLKTIDGKIYYFESYQPYSAQTGLTYVTTEDGEWAYYYFNEAPDFSAVTDQWMFFENEYNDSMTLYYFTKDGASQTEGTREYNGLTYTFYGSGAQLTIDYDDPMISSPSNANNAAKVAANALVKTVNDVTIAQESYDTQEKAESYLQKLINFIITPFENYIYTGFGIASESEAEYQPAVDGTAEAPAAKDGFLKKILMLFHTPGNDREFTATASVALKITGKDYVADEKPPVDPVDPENPAETFTITATAGAGGTIDPSGSVSVAKGEDKTFTIQANNGYRVDKVLVDGENKGTVTSYTFEDVSADHKIEVSFRRTYTGGGSGIGTSGGSSASGAGRAAGATLTPTVGTWVLNQHGQWTMVDPNGNLYRDTWVVYNNQWYYVNADGIMLITWQFINGTWYYFTVTATEGYPVGAMLVNATTPDGYRVDANGAWVQ